MQDEIFIKKEIETSKSAIDIFKQFYDAPYSVFLDSSLINNELGENSIIVFDPFLVFTSKGDRIRLIKGSHIEEYTEDPLLFLRELLDKYKSTYVSELPFFSGAIGYFSYDLCHRIETFKDHGKEDMDIPDMIFGFYSNAIIIDHKCRKTYAAVSSIGFENTGDIDQILDRRINGIIRRVCESSEGNKPVKKMTEGQGSVASNFTLEEYCNMIRMAKEYIRNGDIYQANLSQQFRTYIGDSDPFDIYVDLRQLNPAPFSAYMNFEAIKVLSSSPERFLKINGRTIETRPIKGTRPRGKTKEEDDKLKDELINSEKDRAEHIMIVDLERNDLGRVCRIGSVHVEKMLEIEEYSTVLHLVSTVKGELLDDVDMIDCIKATFPGGSITGAPKIRSMEIIDELEPVKRNIYTGSIGYMDFNGNCDLNIAIRTIVIKDNEAFFNVGGGIVWDSVPEDEYRETLDKGKALLKVLTGR